VTPDELLIKLGVATCSCGGELVWQDPNAQASIYEWARLLTDSYEWRCADCGRVLVGTWTGVEPEGALGPRTSR
jgi:hypothetical protein